MNPIEKVFEQLKKDGFDVYPPANHQGECLKPYLVVKCGTTNKITGLSSTITVIDIMCYVPQKNYSKLFETVEKMKQSMDKLKPMIVSLNTETPDFYDEGVKGHMRSVQYRLHRKL